MKCAIVSLEKNDNKKNSFWDIFRLKRNKICDVNVIHATHNVSIYTIGYSVGQLCEFSEKKIDSIIAKCIKELKRQCVQSVYLTDEVLEFLPCGQFFRQFKVPVGRHLFDLLLCDTIKLCAQKSDIDMLESEVGVWQSCFDEYGYKVLDNICSEFKYITLYTNSETSARACADKLYAQTGLSVKISSNISELNRCDFVIMADEFEKPIANENTIIIDESGMCRFRCKNTIEFSLAFGFNALMEYFGICDQRCMEFLFDICDINIAREDNINNALKDIGCKFKKVLYKSHKNVDKN